jgi:formylglycine-generating enzyme required for sulfatase activity
MVACGLLLAAASAVLADDHAQARFRGTGKADPIRIENVRRSDGPAVGQSSVTFDLAWDQDAAWVFVKFRKRGTDGWTGATLSAEASDHSVPKAAALDVGMTDDKRSAAGVFVYRAASGSGANDFRGVKLNWNHAADGVEVPADVEVRVLSVQMIYVPQSPFWLGDGFAATYSNEYAGQFEAGMSGKPLRIESENALLLGGEDNKNLGSHESHGMRQPEDFTSDATQILPAEFPKGYGAFYCMRNEITEAQWVEYLNMQTYAGQKACVTRSSQNSPDQPPGTPAVGKGGWSIKIKVSGVAPADGKPGKPAVYETSRPFLPCGGLIMTDCTAYSAWTGLRPMTELEYEKACRGPLAPVPGEYAWGTAKISGKTYHRPTDRNADASQEGYALQDAGTANERLEWKGETKPDAETGNAVWQGAMHRDAQGRVDTANIGHRYSARNLRVGIFATPTSDRVAAGASYWGILDLSGNMWERVMVVGSHYGREFAGKHGTGIFRIDGPRLWGTGSGLRGGIGFPVHHPIDPLDAMRVSNRRYSSMISPYNRGWYMSREPNLCTGLRCVRTATIGAPAADAPALVAVPRPMEPPVLGPGRPDEGGRVLRKTTYMDNWKVGIDKVAVAVGGKTATIRFDITWEESWRDEHNHDAAWVFFKARSNEQAEWKHVKLVADKVINPTGYGGGTGTAVDLIVPGGKDGFTGLFVRRAGPGEGALKTQGVKVIGDLAKAEVRAYGIRMVYVPKGPYFLGSGGVEHGGFFKYTDGTQRIEPYQVTSAGAIATGKQHSKLWVRKQGGQLKDGEEIPASFPNGFAAFYAMKHQITPAQYAAFLNSLPKEQAEKRYAGYENWDNVSRPSDIGVNKDHYSGGQGKVGRSAVGAEEPFTFEIRTSRAGMGCFGLSWADGVSFAAWAGLRPMTELELEKMVRGFRKPFANEVGRSYWGISGFNAWDWNAFKDDAQSERAVTVSNEKGLGFKGSHGLGSLTLPADWPQADAVGSGMRCTLYGYGIFDLARPRLSDRLLAAIAEPNRRPSHKWRGVRTAPEGVGP